MNSSKRNFEQFLEPSAALKYSAEGFRMIRVLREMFMSAHRLHDLYSDEIKDVERFRMELSSSLSSDSDRTKELAERWGFFLKTRASLMEPWSSLVAGLIGLLSATSAFLAYYKDAVHIAVMVSLPVFAIMLIALKANFDDRIAWFKYVASHLEAISKVGVRSVLVKAKPPLERVGRLQD
jgi:hypothetical protein